jgi:hypothetical protein
MRLDAEAVAIEITQWWYVEWSPLGAFRIAKVEDAHYRNYEAMKERKAVGYEPVGLFPTKEAALETISHLKRMRKEQRHDEEEAAGVGTAGPGAEDCGTEYPVLGDAAVRGRWNGEGAGEAGGHRGGDADSGDGE